MSASGDDLIGGAATAAVEARQALGPVVGDTVAFATSCVGRRLVLGERADEELEVIVDIVGSHALVAGFYSYGEISPALAGGCHRNDQTMTLTLIGEV